MTRSRSLALCLPLALLAACGDEPAGDDDGRSASGEVLEGTASDAMLPLDQLRSEPPLLQPERAPRAAGDAPGVEATEQAADAEEAEEPAAEEESAAEPEEDEG